MQKMLNRPAFISTVHIPLAVGSNSSVKQHDKDRPTPQPKPKPASITQEYKKWLQQYSDVKQKEKEEEEQRAQKQEEFKKKLADKAQQQRDEIRQIRESDLPEAEKTKRIATIVAGTNFDDNETVSTGAGNAASKERAAPTPRQWVRRPRQASKPAWAYTIEESEEAMDAEADDLLAFTDQLDYDGFVDNLDVKESVRFIEDRQRKEALEREVMVKRAEMEARKAAALAAGVVGEDDENYEWVEVDAQGQTAEEALIARQRELFSKKRGNRNDWNSSTQTETKERAETPITTAELRKTRPDIANVHSDASLRTVASKLAEDRQRTQQSEPYSQAETTNLAIQPPRMIVVDPVDGRDITKESMESVPPKRTVRASNLPYLYRNPAI